MEYCSLGDISQCYPGTLPETETRSMCEQLLEALAVLHGFGITHRDVKPQVGFPTQMDERQCLTQVIRMY